MQVRRNSCKRGVWRAESGLASLIIRPLLIMATNRLLTIFDKLSRGQNNSPLLFLDFIYSR